jgi:hypothetical protein
LELKPGSRLYGTSCTTEVVVVRAPAGEVAVSCCGVPMSVETSGPAASSESEGVGEALLIGKRYCDEEKGLELLCTKGGYGPLACDGRTLVVKASKPLPSSD